MNMCFDGLSKKWLIINPAEEYHPRSVKIASFLRGLSLSDYLKVLTGIAVMLVLYPMISHPLPKYVVTGDVAVHYGYAFLISKNIENVGATLYPKLFHILTAFISNLFGLSIGTSMYVLVFISAVLNPVITYRLSLLLTGHREISLLSSFFSVITMIYTSGNFGIAMPIPQSVALTLLPIVLYLFISKRPVLAGVTLALYMCLHSSWPLVFYFIGLYTLLEFAEKKDKWVFVPAGISMILPFLIYVPYSLYVRSHTIYIAPLFPKAMFSYVSFFSFLWLIAPPGVLLFALYSVWKILKKKEDYTLGYKFVAMSFLSVLLSTQTFFIGVGSPLAGLLSPDGVPLTSERFLTFGLFSIAILFAYAVNRIAKGRKTYVVAICLTAMALSITGYWSSYDGKITKFSDSGLGVMDALKQTGKYNRYVLYNPLYPDFSATRAIMMAGDIPLQSDDSFSVLSKFMTLNALQIDVSYVLKNRDDEEMNEFSAKHASSLKEIYSNDEYVLYEITEKLPASNKTLRDYADLYVWYYNKYTLETHTTDLFDNPFTIRIRSRETNETVCFGVNESVSVISCEARQDFEVEGNNIAYEYLFLPKYGIKPFMTKFLWFYNHGSLTVTPDKDLDLTLSVPNKIRRPLEYKMLLYDAGIYVDIKADEKEARAKLTAAPIGSGYNKISLGFFAKTLEWTELSRSYSYPNAIFGLFYAGVSEAYQQIFPRNDA